MTDKKLKLEIAPGAFDNFEGTQEELDEMLAMLKKMLEDDTRELNPSARRRSRGHLGEAGD
jgi:hypothetical protein